ncbi:MAG: 3-hydroxybutyrate dehydrogenase [Leptolyngbya sp.]|nr:3-hydroxybutyrate dehydrogenase [Candidatus Melainabacteria bacterium]
MDLQTEEKIPAERSKSERKDGRPLHGKVAIITGSTSGIGLGIATAFAKAGASVVLNGLGDHDAVEKTRKSLARNQGVDVQYHAANMENPDDIADMVAFAHKTYGRVDILVNNAGIQHTARVEDFPAEKWNQIIAINLSAAFHSMKAAVPKMREGGFGRIINIASVHGLVASVEKAAYVAAKHGIVGLTKVVALENAENGITANAICPGWVRTPLVEKQIVALSEKLGISIEEASVKLLEEKQPSKRFVEVEQIGEMAVFLAGSAASNITGQTMVMDGGWVAR